jgi:GntR family transcriptional regulator, rspAB operon transcriptional repressor
MAMVQAKKSRSRSSTSSKSRGNISLSERVYQALKKDIVRGVFRPGEALTEQDLAARYQGSRTPVREAAVRLQRENLMQIVANRGYFITEISIQSVNDIYDFRAAIEGASAEFAAQNNWDASAMERLTKLSKMEFVIDDHASYVRFIEADTEFHIGIAELTRNALIVRAVADMRCQMERIMYASVEIGYYGEMPLREHINILKAIQNREGPLARARMCEHVYVSKNKVLGVANRGSRF